MTRVLQRLESLPVSEQLTQFRRAIRRRNQREWFGAAAIGLFFACALPLVPANALTRLFSLELLLAAFYVSWRLHRDGRTSTDQPVSPDHARVLLRQDISRQAQLLAAAPRWHVAPLAMGFMGHRGAILLDREPRVGDFVYFLLAITIGGVVCLVNVRAARSLQAHVGKLTP